MSSCVLEIQLKTIAIGQILRNEKIVLNIVDSCIDIETFNSKHELNGTKISWTITLVVDNTKLMLRHEGLISGSECFQICKGGWGNDMTSLYRPLTTNKGLPFKKG